MNNLCRMKTVMRGRSVYWWFCLLLVLGFTAGLAVEAGAESEYTRPTTNPPTDADLVFIGGESKTLVIQLMNLSPYTLTEDTTYITAMESLDKNRNTKKKSMFAPLGWPRTIPGLQGEWSDSGVWTPSADNASAHPYSFVVAWDDRGGWVENSTLGWTISGVHQLVNNPSWGDPVKNVPLRLWFTRVKPSLNLYSEIFKTVTSTLKMAFGIIGIFKFNVTPCYVNTFLGTMELGNSLFKTWNAVETASSQYENPKMYFAAYTVPDCTTCLPDTVYPGTYDYSDAVDTSWAYTTDNYGANLVVTTHLLRGFDGPQGGIPPAYGFEDDDPHYNNNPGAPRIPIVAVTVWDSSLYMAAKSTAGAQATTHPLGQRLGELLGKGVQARYTQFVSLYKSLNPSQRRTLSEAMDHWLLEQPLTQQEEMLIKKLVSAMENGQTKLPPENRK